MVTALLVIAILVVLIVVHEFGHFTAAKIFKVKVEEFGVGYPPRAFSFGKFGDTEYTLNWIPFGGFVRLFGDGGDTEHGRGSLVDAPRWKQAIILVAGVAMNAVGAWVLFTVGFHLGVPQVVEAPYTGQQVQLMVANVVPGSPADASGLKPGDEIESITDPKGVQVASLVPDEVVNFVSTRGGQPLTVLFLHEGKELSATVTPANAVIPGAAGRSALGVALAQVAIRPEGWGEAATDAFHQSIRALVSVTQNLGSILLSVVRGAPDLAGVVGPVGIVSYVGAASQNGLGSVLLLAALISINLVVINLIPVPALDGGRLLVLVVEGILRRKAPRFIVQLLNAIGVGLIILLMIVVTYHDIGRLLS